jgi:hypothetical protein
MQKHLSSGGLNALDMVWELRLHFNNLLMQKLEVGTILVFWQPCMLQFAKVCWFFFVWELVNPL